jgi:hypothetical protein
LLDFKDGVPHFFFHIFNLAEIGTQNDTWFSS